MIQLLFAAALIFWSVAAARAGDGPAPIESAAQLLGARDAAEASYRISLGELAQWCDERQLASAGKLVREWLPIRDPFKSYIFKLPESLEPQTELNGGGPSAVEFGERFATLRRAQADALFSLAR